VSKVLVGLASSSFLAALSWYTSTVYGVGLDWKDMATIFVQTLQHTFPPPPQGLATAVLTILFLVGTWQTITSFVSWTLEGWYGALVPWGIFFGASVLFWYPDTLVRLGGLMMVVLCYGMAWLNDPE
jgi:hypothetical protein